MIYSCHRCDSYYINKMYRLYLAKLIRRGKSGGHTENHHGYIVSKRPFEYFMHDILWYVVHIQNYTKSLRRISLSMERVHAPAVRLRHVLLSRDLS